MYVVLLCNAEKGLRSIIHAETSSSDPQITKKKKICRRMNVKCKWICQYFIHLNKMPLAASLAFSMESKGMWDDDRWLWLIIMSPTVIMEVDTTWDQNKAKTGWILEDFFYFALFSERSSCTLWCEVKEFYLTLLVLFVHHLCICLVWCAWNKVFVWVGLSHKVISLESLKNTKNDILSVAYLYTMH